jgi:5-hydroxyisourate hydrolase-like protein (transthyretin family)
METVFDIVVGVGPARVELLTANIGVPLAVAFLTAGAGALVMTISAGSASVALNLSQMFQSLKLARLYLLGLVRVKRNKPWGRVLDKLTGRPIPIAMVRVYSAEFKKLLDAHLTDDEGRFDALAVPGSYYVEVSKRGYQKFQSNAVKISSEDQVLNVEIALSPLTEALSAAYLGKIRITQVVKYFLRAATPFILAVGTITSLIVVVVLPTGLNYFIFFVYLALDVLQMYFAYHLKKPFGTVQDAVSGNPLPLSIVRIFDDKRNWLLETKVTDRRGRFDFLLASGTYYLTCTKEGYKAYRSDAMTFKEAGLANVDVEMKKVG